MFKTKRLIYIDQKEVRYEKNIIAYAYCHNDAHSIPGSKRSRGCNKINYEYDYNPCSRCYQINHNYHDSWLRGYQINYNHYNTQLRAYKHD